MLRKTDGKSCFHPSVKVHIFVTDAFELKFELGASIDEKQFSLFEKMDDESGFSLSPKEKRICCSDFEHFASCVTCKGTILSLYEVCCQ